ncbi:hypothetical protein IWX88_000145 [Frigoribacterium sp. CG_9.8]|nr:hypothetical protein [Frigoribacterium sp. CG_9.8]
MRDISAGLKACKIASLGKITPGADGDRARNSCHILRVVGVNIQPLTDQSAGRGRSRIRCNANMDRLVTFTSPRTGNA